jgi:hypothetical protein
MDTRSDNHDWVDDELRRLGTPPGWEPDAARARARLDRRTHTGGRMPRSRVLAWLVVPAAAAALAVLALPPVLAVTGIVGEPPGTAALEQEDPFVGFAEPERVAVFTEDGKLVRPAGYRQWVFVGSSLGLSYAEVPDDVATGAGDLFHNVYIDPAGYATYAETGEFADGTVMILELARSETKNEPGLQGMYEGEFVALEASVKDSARFQGDWAYFGFTERGGGLKAAADAYATELCWTCHAENAQTDMVFTQFYPVLQATRLQ